MIDINNVNNDMHPANFAPSPKQKGGGKQIILDKIDHENYKIS